jgi:hypothetical protein
MLFAKQLRDCIRRGEITCKCVRIWMDPRVKILDEQGNVVEKLVAQGK